MLDFCQCERSHIRSRHYFTTRKLQKSWYKVTWPLSLKCKQAEMLVSHYLITVQASTERLCYSCTQPILARKTKKEIILMLDWIIIDCKTVRLCKEKKSHGFSGPYTNKQTPFLNVGWKYHLLLKNTSVRSMKYICLLTGKKHCR